MKQTRRFTAQNVPVAIVSSAKTGAQLSSAVGLQRLRRDKLFFAALLAAIPVWVVLLLATSHPVDLNWPVTAPWRFTLLVLIYPVVEEIVFRGLIQESLQRLFGARHYGPLSLANLVTSIFFVAVHFVYHAPIWAVAVFVPSLVFGFFKERHGGLRSPIVLHVFYNLGYFWLFGNTMLVV